MKVSEDFLNLKKLAIILRALGYNASIEDDDFEEDGTYNGWLWVRNHVYDFSIWAYDGTFEVHLTKKLGSWKHEYIYEDLVYDKMLDVLLEVAEYIIL